MIEFQEFKDDFVKDIVNKGRRDLPNVNFEDQMILKIQKELDYKKQVYSQLKTSLQFFVGALLLGIGLTLVVLFGKFFAPFDFKLLAILSLFVIGVLGVLNLDNYRRLIKKYSW